MAVSGSTSDYKLGSQTQNAQAAYDPYTEMARAFRFQLLMNPGMIHDMLGAMRTGGGGGSRLAALQARFLPGGIQQSGVPVGMSGSSPLGSFGSPSTLQQILPWITGLISLGKGAKDSGLFNWGGGGGAATSLGDVGPNAGSSSLWDALGSGGAAP